MPEPKHHDEDWLREQYFVEGESQREIGEDVGVSRQAITKAFKKHGIKTGYGASVTLSFNNDGYLQLADGKTGDRALHSRLLATLLVDDIRSLRGKQIHHEVSPYAYHEAFDDAVDLNWAGNISVLTPKEHRSVTND